MRTEESEAPTVAFKSLGCKLNQYEIQAIREGFLRLGFKEVPPDKKSDYYLINTCTVTAQADAEARYLIRSFNRLNPSARIFVTGCYAQADSSAIRSLPGVADVIDNSEKNQILHRVTGLEEAREERGPFFESGIRSFEDHARAFVKVQDGCNYFCSFCKIPFVRGRLVSRPAEKILEEAGRLLSAGYRELVLSGVCLGSYGRDGGGFSLDELIGRIAALQGNFRIRLSSIDPRDTPLSLADRMRDEPKLCHHLHLSLQSGSDGVLKRMRRGYTAEDYWRLVAEIRRRVPDIGLSTDVIVGFPGEEESEALETEKYLTEIRFDQIHFFSYSERPGTRAAEWSPKIPRAEIKARMERLKSIQRTLQTERLQSWVGREVWALQEKRPLADGRQQGLSAEYLRCVWEGPPESAGELVRLRVLEAQNSKIFCLLIH